MCAVLETVEIGGFQHQLYTCGGSLIAPNVILTAAHYFDNVVNTSTITVRCGEWDSKDIFEVLPHQDRNALDIQIHPGFVKRNLKNDYAIITLEREFDLVTHIGTMCL